MRRNHPPLHVLLVLLAALGSSLGLAAEIRTEASRNPVALNESFQLVFVAEQAPDGAPDFSPLAGDFDILDQASSQNIRMINGQFSQEIRWTLTLMARRSGDLLIPPLHFGSAESAPLDLKVLDAAPPAPGAAPPREGVHVEMTVEPAELFPQQQALVRVRLYRAQDIANATLSPPQPKDPTAAVVKKIGQDQEYDTQVNGRRHRVTERRYVLFPQGPGTLEIPPVVFQGEVIEDTGRRAPFGGFLPRGQVQRRESNPLQLEVRPQAQAMSPWLPTPNLQLVESWPGGEPQFRVGEPVTRHLLLLADGLTAAQLPPLAPKAPAGINAYPDRPSLTDRENAEGITGIREERIALVPTREGEFTLPAIELAWWNTELGRVERASLPERRIQVAPKAQPSPAAPPDPATGAQTEAQMGAQMAVPPEPGVAAQTGTPPTAPPTDAEPLPPQVIQDPGLWPWVSLGLLILWLATLLAWWLSRLRAEREQPIPSVVRRPDAARQGLSELKAACLSGKPEPAAGALLRWAASRWPEAPPRSLGSLAAVLASTPAEAEVRALERMLYAPQAEGWDGNALWQSIDRLPPPADTPTGRPDPLAPLYP
jgi:hypothetical protein